MNSLQNESGVFRTLVVPVIIPYYIMAVLAQKSSPLVLRLPLPCIILLSAFRAAVNLDLSGGNVRHQYLNQGLALGMFVLSMRCIIWTFQRFPCTRMPVKKTNHPFAKQSTDVSSALWDAFDLMANLRGIGWNWNSRAKEVRHVESTKERAGLFALKALLRAFCLTVVFDVFVALVNSLAPDHNFSPGTSIFEISYPPLLRYFRASLLTVLAGWTVVIIISLLYEMQTFIGVLFIRQDPSLWPPLFYAPWESTSLADFWGKRWHQLFRHFFVELGARPLNYAFGKPWGILGTFFLSGALHDVGMRGMGYGGGDAVAMYGFFMASAIGIIVEFAWLRYAGRKVDGLWGWLWTLAWLVVPGNYVVDAWARTGLIGSEFIPEEYRPTRLLLKAWGSI